jgi:hypothetical protein
LLLGRIPFALVTSTSAARPLTSQVVSALPSFPNLEIGLINVSLGRPTPVQAQISLSRSGYSASVHGEAGLKRLLQAAQMLRIPAPQVVAEGSSTLDLNLAGAWDLVTPTVSGTAQLRSVHAQVRGLNSPLQIRRADLVIDADAVRVKNLEAVAGDATWRGSVSVPRPCATPESCNFQFHLRSPEVSAVALSRLFNPLAVKRPWYRF